MPTSYPQTEPKFKIGDQVRMPREHRWNGTVYTEANPGAVGTVVEVDHDYGRYTLRHHAYLVTWITGGNRAQSHIDEDCVHSEEE